MADLVRVIAANGDPLSRQFLTNYHRCHERVHEFVSSVAGVEFSEFCSFGQYLKIEAAVKASARKEDILSTMYVLTKLVIKDLSDNFKESLEAMKEERSKMGFFTSRDDKEAKDNEIEWCETGVSFLDELPKELATAKDYLLGKSEYL